MKKKIMIISSMILVIGVLITTIIVNSYESYTIIESGHIIKDKSNVVGVVLLQESEGSSTYVEQTGENADQFPTTGYHINLEKSKCENGGTVSYDSTNNKVLIDTNITDKCYVYFDVGDTPSWGGSGSGGGAFSEITGSSSNYGAFSVVDNGSTVTTTITRIRTTSFMVESNNSNISVSNNVMNIDYIGSGNAIVINTTGYYKLEVWGGGYSTNNKVTGGYAVGIANLNESETIYVYVGGAGQEQATSGLIAGGFNGGGSSNASQWHGGSGGGATHIALVDGVLSTLNGYIGVLSETKDYYISDDILIVAGGAGGSTYGSSGSGGGYNGSGGGTQISPGFSSYSGYVGSFGQGGSLSNYVSGSTYGATGGGGFYGGGATSSSSYPSGAGGSGYIASSRLISGTNVIKHMACYEFCNTSDNSETKTIKATGSSATAQEDYAKIGNGYARITYCGSSADDCI